jgi:hypothetical protein
VIGRFISADSIIPDYYDPQSLNRYAYTTNNPIKYVDPDGNAASIAIAVGVAVGLVYDAFRSPDIANAPDAGTPLQDSPSMLEHVGNFAAGAGVGATFVRTGVKAGIKEVIEEVGSEVSGGLTDVTKAARNLPIAQKTKAIVKYDPEFALRQGASPQTVVPDSYVVVRGGTKPTPPPGTPFSGAAASTMEEAASTLPYGQVRSTTAGTIRSQGGVVELAPEEMYRGGPINRKHVNVTEGGPTVFPNTTVKNPKKFVKPK